MQFAQAAAKTPDQIRGDFSKPLGLMLESQGILSPEQTAKSGEVQAQMIALRDAVEDGRIAPADAKLAVGEFKGDIDFGKLAKMDDAARGALLDGLGITGADIKSGQQAVANAQATRGNVNAGKAIAVPPIGMIHMDLHAKNIPNFGELKQGALMAQRAIDAAASWDRIAAGTPDAAKSSARGFKLWGDESPMLADIIQTCEKLSAHEADASPADPDLRPHIVAAFDETAETFASAGHVALAKGIVTLRQDWTARTTPQPAAVINTDAALKNDDGPA